MAATVAASLKWYSPSAGRGAAFAEADVHSHHFQGQGLFAGQQLGDADDGLRLGAVLVLTLQSIGYKRMALYVRSGKYKKDRNLLLPDTLLYLLTKQFH
jgi:hypothetical protein